MASKKPYYHAVAFISDIHANLQALEAVLQDIEKMNVSAIYCLGDIVGYGPQPLEVLKRIQELKKSGKIVGMVCGNHDYGVIHNNFTAFSRSAKLSNEWTLEQLQDTPQMDFLEELGKEDLMKDIGRFRIVHSTCNPEPIKWEYLRTKNATQNFIERKIVFVGHSHVPAIYSKYSSGKDWNPITLFGNDGYYLLPKIQGKFTDKAGTAYRLKVPGSFPTMILNIGSVGQPRDNNPHARYVVYMTIDFNDYIEYRQVSYPILEIVEKLKNRGLACDEELATRLCTGGLSKFSAENPSPEWFPVFEEYMSI